jgi:hypothetical protein
MHYDNPGPPNKRALTAIVYLNNKWTPGESRHAALSLLACSPRHALPLPVPLRETVFPLQGTEGNSTRNRKGRRLTRSGKQIWRWWRARAAALHRPKPETLNPKP